MSHEMPTPEDEHRARRHRDAKQYGCDLCLMESRDDTERGLRAELAAETNLAEALQVELNSERERHAATVKERDGLRKALEALLPDPTKTKPNVVERHLTMGRMFLRVAGAHVAVEGAQCLDGEYGVGFQGMRQWTGEDFKRIEEAFAAPIRAALQVKP